MTAWENPTVLDHDGANNEAASISNLSESADNADWQNDFPSRGLSSDEVRALIGVEMAKHGQTAVVEPEPDELPETDWLEREFNEQAAAKVDPLELSRRVARNRQEVVDAAVARHIESMLQSLPPKGHEWREAYDRVYRRTGAGAGQAPTMQEVRERIEELLQYRIKDGEADRSKGPLLTTHNLDLVTFLDPVIHHVGITEFGYHPAWRSLLPPWRSDVESETSDKAERAKAAKRDQVDDHDLLHIGNRLRSYFGSGPGAVRKEVVNDTISMYMGGNRFNPWLEHLDALQEWDGVNRIRQPFSNFELSDEEATILENAWLAWIHRWYNPGAQLDSVLVLVGTQGHRKSSYINAITEGVIPMSELDGIPDSAKDKDDYAAIHASPVVAINEIDRLSLRNEGSKNGTDAKLKNLITTRQDSWRDPYGRFSVNHPRPSVFVGTTNHTEFIGDTTGDRRYWVIKITAKILTEDLTREKMDLMLAEARDRYRAGERFRYDEEFEEMAAGVRQKHLSTPTEDAIWEWIETLDPDRIDATNPALRVDVAVITTALIEQQVRFPKKGSPARNDIISAMDRMPGYQRVDLGGKSRIRRMVNGDHRSVGVAWERANDYDDVPGETLSALHEAENRAREAWKTGQRVGQGRGSHGGDCSLPNGSIVSFAHLRDHHLFQVVTERKARMTAGGGQHG